MKIAKISSRFSANSTCIGIIGIILADKKHIPTTKSTTPCTSICIQFRRTSPIDLNDKTGLVWNYLICNQSDCSFGEAIHNSVIKVEDEFQLISAVVNVPILVL